MPGLAEGSRGTEWHRWASACAACSPSSWVWRKQKLCGESCVPQGRGRQNQNWNQAPWTEPLSPRAEGLGARSWRRPPHPALCSLRCPPGPGSGDRPVRASHACHRRPASPGCRPGSQPSAPDGDGERAQPWHFLQRERPLPPHASPYHAPRPAGPGHSDCHPRGLGGERAARTDTSCCNHQRPGAGAASEPLLEPPGARRSPGQGAPLAGTWSD